MVMVIHLIDTRDHF